MVQVATQDEVTAAEQRRAQEAAEARAAANENVALTQLASFIRSQWQMMRDHRNSIAGWSERLLHAQRVFNGKYDAQKLREIQQFGGSAIYSRMTAVKCRGASSLLREVYLGSDKPWGLDPTPEPTLPDDIMGAIKQLVMAEMQTAVNGGQQLDMTQVRDRVDGLKAAARNAAVKKAREEAKTAETKLDDFLVEGGFYKALAEFLVDLPVFPIAIIKGPVVRIVPAVTWERGVARTEQKAKMFWSRVSPFDLYWTPGVSDITDASVIEVTRLTRADLNDLLGVPGYDEQAIRQVLQDYGRGGLRDWMDGTDSERAVNENREDPTFNQSGIIDCVEYHGNVQGRMLLDWGMEEEMVPDADRDYFIQAWLIGRHIIKVQVNPSPRKRHPYFVTSFEKVPGTPVGNALPDILGDLQDAANASLRSLVNNMSIASGPQVVIDDNRLVDSDENDNLYPWKRWHVSNDPMSPTNNGSQKPIDFFQPNSNAQELLGIYEKLSQMADETSAIPRYITGSERLGGAGRTASGLAMLMGNASKILQTVAANIDRDIIEPLVSMLYDMVMLTDTSGVLRGDESIRVRGVDVAVQRETDRQRQMEFLQATMNPVDMAIIGPINRAKILRSVSGNIGLDGDDVVPPEDELKQQLAAPPPPANDPGQPVTQPGNGPHPANVARGAQPPAPASGALGAPEGAAMRGMAG
ncbi:hypothetical protein [Methylobacterium sp. 285MFTsu5.1]|uniref:portal protein n=1 Tax=Methylobacterium sp. 285MFTsu5.1 TaxID=1172187 RepID=UPI00038224E0|nr:hypothetical protein [Methylobacterium sp. 285MFTsu5.1]